MLFCNPIVKLTRDCIFLEELDQAKQVILVLMACNHRHRQNKAETRVHNVIHKRMMKNKEGHILRRKMFVVNQKKGEHAHEHYSHDENT